MQNDIAITLTGTAKALEFTPSQLAALDQIEGFLGDGLDRCFVLQGYAGTGKTFLMAHLARLHVQAGRIVHLLAPTGRAARVLRKATGLPASTLHSHLYRLDELEVEEARSPDESDRYRYRFSLAHNEDAADAVYIVDEASLIPDTLSRGELLQFGSGRLLADLIEFVFAGAASSSGRRILFVGDPAQLPPVTDSHSNALDPAYLTATFGVRAAAAELIQVVRQREDSAILEIATGLRDSLRRRVFSHFQIVPRELEVRSITAATAADLVQSLPATIEPAEIFITHSNEAASRYNEMARARHFPGEGAIQPGDRVMIVANCRRDGVQLFNGDFARVAEVSGDLEVVAQPLARKRDDGSREMVRLAFRPVELEVLDEQGTVRRISSRIIENLLDSRARDLSPAEFQALFLHFVFRHPRLKKNSPEFLRALQADPWFNALRIKYAYAVTCHKAQGGEWARAIVDLNTGLNPSSEAFFRWAYTAITRARETLVAIDPPDLRPDGGVRPVGMGSLIVAASVVVEPERPRPGLSQRARGSTVFEALLACQIHDELAAIGARLLESDHKPYQFRFVAELGAQRAQIVVFYNGQQRVTRALAQPPSHRELADLLLARITLLQARAFVAASSAPATASPAQPAADLPAAPSVPFPPAPAHDAMARFDAFFRPRVLGAGLSIATIDILNSYQVRYVFAHGPGRASLLFFFNGRGCCTTCSVDARRTTDPAVAQAVMELTRGGAS